MSSNEGSRNGEGVGSRVDDSITDHDGIIDQEVLTCCSTPDGELKVPILEVCGLLDLEPFFFRIYLLYR